MPFEIEGFRPPRQARSAATLNRIAGAASELLAVRTPSEVSVRELVRRAGTSVGAFYARFDDKETALHYAHDDFWNGIEDRWAAYLAAPVWEDANAREIAATVLRMLVRTWLSEGERLRGFLRLAATAEGEDMRERIAAVDASLSRRVAAKLVATTDPIASGKGEVDIRAVEGFRGALGALRDFVLLGPRVTPESAGARELILRHTRTFFGSAGLDPLPGEYADVLALCVRGPLVPVLEEGLRLR